jgi:hypothetical protein
MSVTWVDVMGETLPFLVTGLIGLPFGAALMLLVLWRMP